MPDPAEFADWTVTMTAPGKPTVTATYRRCSEGQARKFAHMSWAAEHGEASILEIVTVERLP